jgi:CheY-like chemotaxis protein
MDKAILCVDDEPIILLAMRQELRAAFGASWTIEFARDGPEALAAIPALAAEGVDVQVLVTDMLMPGMSGDRLVAEALRLRPGIKAVIVTGKSEEEGLEGIRRENGVAAVLRKPWPRGGLARAVETAIGGAGPG